MKQFERPIDFIIFNDWLTGHGAQEVLFGDCGEIGIEAPPHLTEAIRIFMIHNIYDQKRSFKQAEKNNLSLPSYIHEQPIGKNENEDLSNTKVSNARAFSPFRTGTRLSDWLIVDGNYLDTLLEGPTQLPPATKTDLKSKRLDGRYTTVVHAPSDIFNPVENLFLSCDGFQALPKEFFSETSGSPLSMQILKEYKRTNRLALQRKYANRDRKLGYLDEDEDAIIYSYAGRFDPYQKGFFLMASTLKSFLLKNPHVQVIIAGGGGAQPAEERIIDEFLTDLLNDKELRGRFVRAGEADGSGAVRSLDTKGVVQLLAGSSALMCPSLYEPYGLSQLEAMWLGSSPVAHAVDGFLSTIRDIDEEHERHVQACRPHPRFGATGFLMPKIGNPSRYEFALRAWFAEQSSECKHVRQSTDKRKLLDAANKAFMDLLERSLAVMSDEERHLQIVSNGIAYVQEEHNWAAISMRYREAIESAKSRREEKPENIITPAAFTAVGA